MRVLLIVVAVLTIGVTSASAGSDTPIHRGDSLTVQNCEADSAALTLRGKAVDMTGPANGRPGRFVYERKNKLVALASQRGDSARIAAYKRHVVFHGC